MSNEQESSTEQSLPLTNDCPASFDSETLHNLVGFFDVLIQMDLEQKSKEQRDDNNRSQHNAD